jgi:hypothetical protein
MKKYPGILLLFLTMNCFSQEFDNYTGEWGVSSYDTLTSYTSLLWDVLPTPSLYEGGDIPIDIGFPFPYYDEIYHELSIRGMGYVFFGLNWYEIYVYAAFFERHMTLPIHSDWRMQRDTAGMDILKFEWKDIGILYDIIGSNPTDHRMNFQLWLYENGIIEYHFGHMDLDNTPWFSPSGGFKDPQGWTIGPWVMAVRRELIEEHYFLCDEGEISFFSGGELSGDVYRCVPEYGTWFRFIPNEITKTKNIAYNRKESVLVKPNPVIDKFRICMPQRVKDISETTLVEIYNQMGAKVFSRTVNLSSDIDISSFPAGCYSVLIADKCGIKYHSKLIKIIDDH